MSREIKFRSWDGNSMVMRNQSEYNSVTVDCFFNSGLSLMQYTGIKDKNGKEIYEGDIVEVAQYDCAVDRYINGSKHVVEWHSLNDYPAFDLTPVWDEQLNSFSSILNSDMFSIRVIGNIHENEELLK